jgi:predicted MPP superfamily phosphohydrolase
MTPQDFSQRTHFPGTESSSFDYIVRIAAIIGSINPPLFAALLFLLALVPTRANLPLAVILWAFFLADWGILAALPRFGKSYGPSNPSTLLLACLRSIPAILFPLPWGILAQVMGTHLVIYGFWIEPHRIRVTRQTLQSNKLRTTKPLRLLHFGDLHVERLTGRERQLMELCHSLAPDLILFSGDFLNLSNVRDPVALEQTRTLLSGLSAPLGVFAVSGSPPVDKPEVVAKLLQGLDIRWLRDEQVTVTYQGQTIDLVGITCTHKPFIDAAKLDSIVTQKPDHLAILLYHSPDLAPEAALRGMDLQFSGHTHGGQVRLPIFGALYTASLYGKRLEVGRRQVNGLTLYVTRGVGMEGMGAPRVRFLCPPEVVLWEISGSKA